MNKRRYQLAALAALTVLALAWMPAAAKDKVQKIYAFGFAASFNDSTVYFTDIQEIDSAWVDEHTKFVVGRDNYSYQLRNYLAERFEPDRTCVFTYSLDRKDIEKKYVKMKERYTRAKYAKKHGQFDVKYLTRADFAYQAVPPIDYGNGDRPKAKSSRKERKAQKAEARKGRPQGADGERPDGPPPGGKRGGKPGRR